MELRASWHRSQVPTVRPRGVTRGAAGSHVEGSVLRSPLTAEAQLGLDMSLGLLGSTHLPSVSNEMSSCC